MRRLRNLLDGLPPQARVHQVDPRSPWLMQDELMAQMIEVLSISAAERRLEKPMQVPRPGDKAKKDQAERKHGGLFMAAMQKQGGVKVG